MRTLKLMADYQCFPLWEASPGEVGNVNPASLPISSVLQSQLMDWADVYDGTLNLENPACSGFMDTNAKAVFNMQGIRLADQLRNELGPEYVVVVNVS